MLDNDGNIDIRVLRAVDKSCGDKLSHGMTSSVVGGVEVSEGHCETKKCPKCDKNMIKRDGSIVLTSYPPQYPWHWWCGGCGHVEKGGIRSGQTSDEIYQKEWERANG